MDKDTVVFATYCIGNLSRRLGQNARDVYERLKASGILNGYIVPSYDVLHTSYPLCRTTTILISYDNSFPFQEFPV